MLSILLPIVSFFIPLLVIGIVIYIIVMMTKNKDGKTKFKLSAKTLLQIYLFVISFLTLGIAVIGGVTAIRASVSYIFEVPFSYTLQRSNSYMGYNETTPIYEPGYPVKEIQAECYQGNPIHFHGSDFCFDSNERKTDLINGISLFLSMTILFAIHQYAISKIGEEKIISWLKKIYTFASLILYSIVSIVAIPTAIFQLTNYILFETNTNVYSTPSAPAMAIAVVLLAVPLWILFLRETTKLKEE